MSVCTICHVEPCRATANRHAIEALDPDTRRMLESGRLSGTCPICHHTEPAGWWYSQCFTLTGPATWSRVTASDEVKAARKAGKAADRPISRPAPNSEDPAA